ncbi:hypothetical protein Z043_122125 [Scleropages formosus]|uniref:Uncharacterized protein n=1 Tax=Scleropages formosus TaxID=113540 RepID=A0A0N8JW45_SCLFO|nr:hypothetical protein Z043_122125 [Scleropages formosus]
MRAELLARGWKSWVALQQGLQVPRVRARTLAERVPTSSSAIFATSLATTSRTSRAT